MYATLANHFSQGWRYFFTFAFLIIILPRLLFPAKRESFLDSFFRNFIRMTLVLITLGYLLVLLKLFEFLSLVVVFIVLYLYVYRHYKGLASWGEMIHVLLLFVYDYADGIIHPQTIFREYCNVQINKVKQSWQKLFGSLTSAGKTLLLLIVLGYSAWIRFYDTILHAAPAMSDSYVVLAWLKYLDRKILFHDGIYPQGFHIYLDFLHKFSAIDALYVLNYSGPLHSVFITLSLYFVVSRWTRQVLPGITAAFIYGVLGFYLNAEFMRQAATNSQEFAFVFLFPTLYYYSEYLTKKDMDSLVTAAAGTFLTGLIHSMAFAFLGLGLGILALVFCSRDLRTRWQIAFKMLLIYIAGGLTSAIPIGIGLLMGKDFYGASAEFLIMKTEAGSMLPWLNPFDYIGLGVTVLLLLLGIIFSVKRREVVLQLYIAFFGLVSFAAFYWGGALTGNVVISTRMVLLWTMMIPILCGVGWYTFSKMIPFFRGKISEVIIAIAMITFLIIKLQPIPIIPYKMEYDSSVEQYLRISSTFRPTEWMIVSQVEGYALTYGKGYHLMLPDFLTIDPSGEKLLYVSNGQESELDEYDIFIFHEKKVFRSLEEMEAVYDKREIENKALKDWLEKYQKAHDNLTVYYEDENIAVYRIYQPASEDQNFERIWNNA